MTTQVFIFRLLFGLYSLVIGAGLLYIAYNRGKVVLARGEGESFFSRWQSGSRRMLNGQQQKWDIGSKACLGLCFLFTAITTGINLASDRTAGEFIALIVIFGVLFTATVIIESVAAVKSRKATKATLALPDPLELAKQKGALEERIGLLESHHLGNDKEAITILKNTVETLSQIQTIIEGKGAT